MLIHFLLPSSKDMLTESYEPTKTLRFLYTHGHQVHKWGPMPGFVFAPIYSILLAWDKLTGHLEHVSSQYPFGFDNPVKSLGNMIFAARVTALLLALSGIYYLTRTLQKVLGDGLAPSLAALLSLSTSFVFLEALCDTKPDGVMIAFLIFALANYAAIVLQGFTRARSIGLGFFYVASFSCKELTLARSYSRISVCSPLQSGSYGKIGLRVYVVLEGWRSPAHRRSASISPSMSSMHPTHGLNV